MVRISSHPFLSTIISSVLSASAPYTPPASFPRRCDLSHYWFPLRVTLFHAISFLLPPSTFPFTLQCLILLGRCPILVHFVLLLPYFIFPLQADGAVCMPFYPI